MSVRNCGKEGESVKLPRPDGIKILQAYKFKIEGSMTGEKQSTGKIISLKDLDTLVITSAKVSEKLKKAVSHRETKKYRRLLAILNCYLDRWDAHHDPRITGG